MKDALIKLVLKKKLESNFLYNHAYRYSHKESVRYYLWLCDLQKKLRDDYGIQINIRYYCSPNDGFQYSIFKTDKDVLHGYNFTTYESALEESLYESVKLIK